MPSSFSSPFFAALSTGKLSDVRTLLNPRTPEGWGNLLRLNGEALAVLRSRISAAPGQEWVRRLAMVKASPLYVVLVAAVVVLLVLPRPALLLFLVGAGLLASAWWEATGKALRDLDDWLTPLSASPSHWTAAAACVASNAGCAAYHQDALASRELLVADALALEALLIAPAPERRATEESGEAATARAVLWPVQDAAGAEPGALRPATSQDAPAGGKA